VDAQNAQIWMASVVIGIEPKSAPIGGSASVLLGFPLLLSVIPGHEMDCAGNRMSVMQDSQARRAIRLSVTRGVRVAWRHGDGRCQRRRVRFLGGNMGTWRLR